jgi:predicted RecA/RadA family phage recombinase
MRSISKSAVVRGVMLALTMTSMAAAQSGSGHQHGASATPKVTKGTMNSDAADAASAVHEAMGHDMTANSHMRMTPTRKATAADSARAGKIVAEAKEALVRFTDVRVAEREGYKKFAPNVKQPVYHFTSMRAAFREHFTFDPARPSSLLYKEDADGSMRLVGAMYGAPQNASMDELNERVPLGIARWHLHTNMCVPRLTQLERWKEFDGGKPVFGPLSPIATRSACDSVDGRFLPVVFGWMVHVNLYEDDVWGAHH